MAKNKRYPVCVNFTELEAEAVFNAISNYTPHGGKARMHLRAQARAAIKLRGAREATRRWREREERR